MPCAVVVVVPHNGKNGTYDSSESSSRSSAATSKRHAMCATPRKMLFIPFDARSCAATWLHRAEVRNPVLGRARGLGGPWLVFHFIAPAALWRSVGVVCTAKLLNTCNRLCFACTNFKCTHSRTHTHAHAYKVFTVHASDMQNKFNARSNFCACLVDSFPVERGSSCRSRCRV